MLEIIKNICLVFLIILLALASTILHRIGTIRKWEIEQEREAAKQPEFGDNNAI